MNKCKKIHFDYCGITKVTDFNVINHLMTHPSIFYHANDIGCEKPADFKLDLTLRRDYYTANTYEHPHCGIFGVDNLTTTTVILHVGFLPCARGYVAKMSLIDLLEMLAKQGVITAVAYIAPSNSAVKRYAQFVGFTQTGIIPGGIVRNRQLEDLLIFSRRL
jgi:hypothetical protein